MGVQYFLLVEYASTMSKNAFSVAPTCFKLLRMFVMFRIYLTLSFPPSIVNASVSAFILFALDLNLSDEELVKL